MIFYTLIFYCVRCLRARGAPLNGVGVFSEGMGMRYSRVLFLKIVGFGFGLGGSIVSAGSDTCILFYCNSAWDTTDNTYIRTISDVVTKKQRESEEHNITIIAERIKASFGGLLGMSPELIMADAKKIVDLFEEKSRAGIKNIHFFTFGPGAIIAAIASQLLALKTSPNGTEPINNQDLEDVTASLRLICRLTGGSSSSITGTDEYKTLVNVFRSNGSHVRVVTHASEQALTDLQTAQATFQTSASSALQKMVNGRDNRRFIDHESDAFAGLVKSFEPATDETSSGAPGQSALASSLCGFFTQAAVTVLQSAVGRAGEADPASIMIHIFGSSPLPIEVPFKLDRVTVQHYDVAVSEKVQPSGLFSCCKSMSPEGQQLLSMCVKAALGTAIKLAAGK